MLEIVGERGQQHHTILIVYLVLMKVHPFSMLLVYNLDIDDDKKCNEINARKEMLFLLVVISIRVNIEQLLLVDT